MASLIRDNTGKRPSWRVQYVANKRRRSIRLGVMKEAQAQACHAHIEALIGAREANDRLDATTARWLSGVSDAIHKRLAKCGLVEPRVQADALTLGDLLTRFEETLSVKASTSAAYKQATESLRRHIGESTALDAITPVVGDQWRKALSDEGLALATISKRVRVARSVFARAVRWELVARNPLEHIKAGSQSNPDRSHYIPDAHMPAILDACSDDQWRGVIALVRYAGLRCPSEVSLLRWGDVNWERGRLAVRSPKTSGHEGHATRMVPIDPRLRPVLQRLFDDAEPGTEWVIPRLRDASMNLRTTFHKVIKRAGYTPWPRAFHNLRASCECDWVERFPNHVVASWLGHSPTIAAKHYLTTRDAHFSMAAGLDGEPVHIPAQQGGAGERDDTGEPASDDANAVVAGTCAAVQGGQWARRDSNPRRLPPTDLQSVPFGHSGTRPVPRRGSPAGREI